MNHPAGRIGKRLMLRVCDLMLTHPHLPIARPEEGIMHVGIHTPPFVFPGQQIILYVFCVSASTPIAESTARHYAYMVGWLGYATHPNCDQIVSSGAWGALSKGLWVCVGGK